MRAILNKAFMLLPLTFLFAPFLYSLLGYHPGMPAFPALVYLWLAVFLYLGMAAAFLLKKYKYLAYPAVAAAAFLCKDLIRPFLSSQKMVILDITEEGGQILIEMPRTPGEITWYVTLIFLASALIGFLGIYYSKYSALDFVRTRNTFLFVNIIVIGAAYYFIIGIMDVDKRAAGFYVFCLAAFFIFYFLVRNFALLNRQI